MIRFVDPESRTSFGLSREYRSGSLTVKPSYRHDLIGLLSKNHPDERNVQLMHSSWLGISLYSMFAEYCKMHSIMPFPVSPEKIGIDDSHGPESSNYFFQDEEIYVMLQGKDIHFLGSYRKGQSHILTAKPMRTDSAQIGLFYKESLDMFGKVFRGRGQEQSLSQIYGLRTAK
jgi:hypothetical protein